jgi:hypothetical protein
MVERSSSATQSGELVVVAAVGVVVCLVGFDVFAGAWLAAVLVGGRVPVDLVVWLHAAVGLVSDPGDPAAAWGPAATALPGPVLYWACTVVSTGGLGGLGVTVVRAGRRVLSPKRERFGVETDARLARRRELRPLRSASAVPARGRFLLGRPVRGPGFLATEDPGLPSPSPPAGDGAADDSDPEEKLG